MLKHQFGVASLTSPSAIMFPSIRHPIFGAAFDTRFLNVPFGFSSAGLHPQLGKLPTPPMAINLQVPPVTSAVDCSTLTATSLPGSTIFGPGGLPPWNFGTLGGHGQLPSTFAGPLFSRGGQSTASAAGAGFPLFANTDLARLYSGLSAAGIKDIG